MIDIDEDKEADKIAGIGHSLKDKINESFGGSCSHNFGHCNDCKRFCYIRYELGEYKAVCDAFNIKLDHRKKIIECSQYSQKTFMSIWDMQEIATIIKVKDKVGFRS